MPRATSHVISRKKYPPIKMEFRTYGDKQYPYYTMRFTMVDNATGKSRQKKLTSPTKKELQEKYDQLMDGQMQTPSPVPQTVPTSSLPEDGITLEEWLNKWLTVYCKSLKHRTLSSYRSNCEQHIIPALGGKLLCELTSESVQDFYNNLRNIRTGKKLSAKTMKNIHGTLHKALEKAMILGYIPSNPSNGKIVELPKVYTKEISPFEEDDLTAFLRVIEGNTYKDIYMVCLFLGLREGEALGLSWDNINFIKKTVTIKQQLQKNRETKEYEIIPTKNGKIRVLCAPDFLIDLFQEIKEKQKKLKKTAGKTWQNKYNLVFTNELGRYMIPQTVYCNFKRRVREIGCGEKRIHDLRHTFATLSLENGDDIKTVQVNLGHSTPAFTLGVYGHSTDEMKKKSAEKMSQYAFDLQKSVRSE